MAGIPGGNLAVRQVEHTQVVAGNQPVLEVAGRPQVQDNQDLVGHLDMVGDIRLVQAVGNLPVDKTCQLLVLCSQPTNVPRVPYGTVPEIRDLYNGKINTSEGLITPIALNCFH